MTAAINTCIYEKGSGQFLDVFGGMDSVLAFKETASIQKSLEEVNQSTDYFKNGVPGVSSSFVSDYESLVLSNDLNEWKSYGSDGPMVLAQRLTLLARENCSKGKQDIFAVSSRYCKGVKAAKNKEDITGGSFCLVPNVWGVGAGTKKWEEACGKEVAQKLNAGYTDLTACVNQHDYALKDSVSEFRNGILDQ